MATARRLAVRTIRLPFNSGDFEAIGLISTAMITPDDERWIQMIWIVFAQGYIAMRPL
jgi:hypothetical protein